MTRPNAFALALALTLPLSAAAAQETPPPATAAQATAPAAPQPAPATTVRLYEMVLRDGSRLYGSIQSEDGAEVVFRTQSGSQVTTSRAEIVSLRMVTGSIVEGEFQPVDPNATRLFFGPTGRSLGKGQVYLGVYEFIMPFVQVGLTDRLSIGGGTPLVFGLGDDWDRPFWITPKLQVFEGESTAISVGAFQAFGIGDDTGGIVYGVGTFGRQHGSVTVGAGVAYAGSENRAGVLMVGGQRQVRRNMALVTENYIWDGGSGVASAGIRFFGERLSADLALWTPIGADDFFVLPVVNFVYVFNGRR